MKKLIIIALLMAGSAQSAQAGAIYNAKLDAAMAKLEQCRALGLWIRNTVYSGKQDEEPRQKFIDQANANIEKLGIGEDNRDLIRPSVDYAYDHAFDGEDARTYADVHLCTPRVNLP